MEMQAEDQESGHSLFRQEKRRNKQKGREEGQGSPVSGAQKKCLGKQRVWNPAGKPR